MGKYIRQISLRAPRDSHSHGAKEITFNVCFHDQESAIIKRFAHITHLSTFHVASSKLAMYSLTWLRPNTSQYRGPNSVQPLDTSSAKTQLHLETSGPPQSSGKSSDSHLFEQMNFSRQQRLANGQSQTPYQKNCFLANIMNIYLRAVVTSIFINLFTPY